ncbi:hypothetical protein [Marinobacterium sediminicola]|uniref:WYL domain-containing protein n=1 Tax=Marinobacterium sediminicola TaxID=518898 RepID=A0ABY1S2B3_9GAMM|nr:hypothetical protein [Marinobacterium sediminicola]ULG68548.1 hypothetical protein LN244_12695 [Marinobacterium sediminicola]SMR76585.1 hypothetical protein SAMN04487964_1124 [Marinobacterium sediminicola]
MTLQQELQLRLANVDRREIAQLMGYRPHRIDKCVERIQLQLTDPYLGLGKGRFDFKYSDEGFLRALCELVGLGLETYEDEIAGLRRELDERRQVFKSYVFVDTGFQRTTEPVFVLALSESRRRIYLDADTRMLPMDQQVSCVQKMVRDHFEACKGTLGIWGNIRRYLFVYEENEQLILTPDGIIVRETVKEEAVCAQLSSKGKVLSGVLLYNHAGNEG